MNVCVDGWMDGCIDVLMDGWMDGWMQGDWRHLQCGLMTTRALCGTPTSTVKAASQYAYVRRRSRSRRGARGVKVRSGRQQQENVSVKGVRNTSVLSKSNHTALSLSLSLSLCVCVCACVCVRVRV
jgi:hypothetical protein